MELPNSPFYRRWSVILAGVIGLAAIAAMLGWRGLQEVATPAAATTTTTTVTVAPSTSISGPVVTTAPPTSYGPTSKPDEVLWHKRGKDVASSPGFRAPERWRVLWAFDCTNFSKYGGGNFKITGDGAFGQIQIEKVAIEASGTKTYTYGGFGHLKVESVCDSWTVTALAG